MNRQVFFRVVLSLLLLLSQQMASAHALSHLAGKIGDVQQLHIAADDGEASSAAALDQGCNQCLGFAQLAGPLASTYRAFVAGDAAAVMVAARAVQAICARTVCVFQSRAPPQA
jgi:hypothetical protein